MLTSSMLFSLAATAAIGTPGDISPAFAAADVARGTLQDLAAVHVAEEVHVDLLLGAGRETLVLEPHSLRAPGYRLWIDRGDGQLVPGPVTEPATYRGHVTGYPDSRVSASVRDGRIFADVDLGPGFEAFGVQPAADADGLHLVYDAADREELEATCGTTSLDFGGAAEGSPPDGGGGFKVCEIACDADFEFFQSNSSSVSETEGDIEFILAGVENIYAAEVEILYEITAIIVRTAEPDPYSSSVPETLLNQFASEWSINQGGIHRDVAHLFTGRNLNGSTIGIASLGTLCSGSYGLSQSKYSGNVINRRALTAHELGHNWGSPHCDGASDCAIMCSGLGGCSGEKQEFGSFATNQILNTKVQISDCLGDPGPLGTPELISVAPFAVSAFMGGEVDITGTDLSNPQGVSIGGLSLPSSNYEVISNSKIRLKDPLILDVGLVPVTVTTLAGESNEVFLNVSPAAGTQFVGPFVAFGGNDYLFQWTAPAGDPYLLLYNAASSQTAPLAGFDVLVNPGIALFGVISPAGTGGFGIAYQSGSFITLSLQILTFDAQSLQPSAATNVHSTTFL